MPNETTGSVLLIERVHIKNAYLPITEKKLLYRFLKFVVNYFKSVNSVWSYQWFFKNLSNVSYNYYGFPLEG